ncbi:MAG: NERD domain-containing protein [Gammaproteobacteria bacterium]
MRPNLTEEALEALPSAAEAEVYRALRSQLPDSTLVIHSITWLYRKGRSRISEGEADFTIFVPGEGCLTIEVKGGGIEADGQSGDWFSIPANGGRRPIKNPFQQAQRARYAIRDQLVGHPAWSHWRGRSLQMGHAVFFPAVTDREPFVGPGRPREIIGVRTDLVELNAWIRSVLAFWRSTDFEPPTPIDLDAAEAIFSNSIFVRPPLALQLANEEAIRIKLTDQQARILRILGGRARAAIGGGAGTGKTLIAVQKARIVAAEGKRTLLLCYNRPLADALASAQRGVALLDVMSYHQLCHERAADAARLSDRDVIAEAKDAYPGADLHDIQLPFALVLANELVPQKYDALIVDEAQDFRPEYWLGLESLGNGGENGVLYLFFDPNQALYTHHRVLPITDEPHWLTINCRNTEPIHRAAYRHYEGQLIDPPEILGSPISHLDFDTFEEQAAAIAAEVNRLIVQEHVSWKDITVLVAGRPKRMYYDLLAALKLGERLTWSFEDVAHRAIHVDTVPRFKGLEAAVVLLWLSPTIDSDSDREMLYVGMSRGKSHLTLVGTPQACAAVLGE